MKSWGDFNNLIVIDYEFRGGDGNPQYPICSVAKDLNSGTILSHWFHHNETQPNYPIDNKTLIIAFYASAEIGCHQALNFKTPPYILDLYAEFRCLTNGAKIPCGNSLLGACAYYGIKDSDAALKEEMREYILQGSYSEKGKRDILEYCKSDVELTANLFSQMKPDIDLPYALLRGRYMAAVASMEFLGVPIDIKNLAELKDYWEIIKDELIWRVDQQYHIYEGTTFKISLFAKYLEKHQIPWDYTPSGLPKTDDAYMRMQAKAHPQLKPLQELRYSLGQLKLNDLQIGEDGRNRCLLSPFRSKTSRNQPSSSKFIFGNATWVRHLIKPQKGTAIAYIDYAQQEIAIASALSGDKNLTEAYNSGDPYLAFAIAAHAIPSDGTKETYPEIREQYKTCMLALNYGMSTEAFAKKAKISLSEAKLMVKWHKQRFSQYWKWNSDFIDTGMLAGLVKTNFNWYFQTTEAKYRTLMNWPMQSNGADILRLAISMCVDHGIKVIAPVHDAILIEAPIDKIKDEVAKAQKYMELASKFVLNFKIHTDAKIFCYPEHYTDPRGEVMWNHVWNIIHGIDPAEKKARLLEKFMVDVPLDNWSGSSTKLKSHLSKKQQRQRKMKPTSDSEEKMVQRIKKISTRSHMEIMHLVNEARDTDFDLEHEIDWTHDTYEAAKERIRQRKTIKDTYSGDF